MVKLLKEEIVTIDVLHQKGESNQAIAKRLNVTEGTVRYHLKRKAQNAVDRRTKESLIQKLGLQEVVKHWWTEQQALLPADRSPNTKSLWTMLCDEHAYSGSYKSVHKYASEHFPPTAKRPFRRVETPPAAQVQSDWLETNVRFRDASGLVSIHKLYGFIMVLSHSRKSVVIWSQSMDQLAWHRVHNEAFKRLGGIAAVNRIDNLKTGVASGSGSWGQVNSSYASYARTMGFHVDPHQARQPQQKGKVERRVGAFKSLDFSRIFSSIQELQSYSDETLQRDSVVRKCPATGESIHATWLKEKELLRPLPATLPEPFDLIKQVNVHKDCTIRFEGRTYAVPFPFANKRVEVRGCSGIIQILDPTGSQIVKQYPRKTKELLLIDQDCYEASAALGFGADAIPKPLPLGQISRKIESLSAQGVATRSIDFYAAIAAHKANGDP